METMDYAKIYETVGIKVVPLPENYSPERYGRALMASSFHARGVSYDASTRIPEKSKQQPYFQYQ